MSRAGATLLTAALLVTVPVSASWLDTEADLDRVVRAGPDRA